MCGLYKNDCMSRIITYLEQSVYNNHNVQRNVVYFVCFYVLNFVSITYIKRTK